ncbi:uncharacterized protein [Montipora foliosa]|uniref:uncharacterized protein n=1 Tax=Montipora foliosa TaxID=591990 RepID=UPI0035F18890
MDTRSVFVLAKVVSIRNKFFYPCCTKCHKKVHTRCDDESIFSCQQCMQEYNAESVQYRYRVSLLASDRSQLVQITVFGSCLDRFFGTSATFFARFLNGSVFDALPSHLVYQAVQQCFVGSLLQFGFRISPTLTTTSKIPQNSSFHLKNIIQNKRALECANCNPEGLPSLLACQILPCSSHDQQMPTVLQILNEYLQLLRATPKKFSVETSQQSPMKDYSKSERNFIAGMASRCVSPQIPEASSIYCTPKDFCPGLVPLILTGQSQPSYRKFLMQGEPQGSNKTRLENACTSLTDEGNHTALINATVPHLNEILTPDHVSSGQQENAKVDEDLIESQAQAEEWVEWDDFPSSEDLSAFLADLESDDRSGKIGQYMVTSGSKSCPITQPPEAQDGVTSQSLTPENVTSDETRTSIFATFKEVLFKLSKTPVQNDQTTYADFLSSDDLNAFLADMDFDCDNTQVKNPILPLADDGAKAFQRKCTCSKREVDNIIAISDANIKDTNSLLKSNNPCHREDNRVCPTSKRSISPYFLTSYVDETDSFIKSSVSRFKMDYERVLTKLFEDDCCNEDSIGVGLLSDFAKADKQSTRQTKYLCLSEYDKKDINEMSQEHNNSSVIQPRDLNINETDLKPGSKSIRTQRSHSNFERNEEVSLPGNDISTTSSPILFSQSMSGMDGNCSKTIDLFTSQGFIDDESPSCTRLLSGTPDLFSHPRTHPNPMQSYSRHEMNSASLFASSDYSYISSLSPVSSESNSIRNELQNQFHSTPCLVRHPSKTGGKPWTSAQISPLLSNSIQTRLGGDLVGFQESPMLFSPMSNTSCE